MCCVICGVQELAARWNNDGIPFSVFYFNGTQIKLDEDSDPHGSCAVLCCAVFQSSDLFCCVQGVWWTEGCVVEWAKKKSLLWPTNCMQQPKRAKRWWPSNPPSTLFCNRLFSIDITPFFALSSVAVSVVKVVVCVPFFFLLCFVFLFFPKVCSVERLTVECLL
jgi:hypothetical protein